MPLHYAYDHWTTADDIEEMIHDAFPKALEIPDKDGNLPLHLACLRMRTSIHKFLTDMNFLLAAFPEGLRVKTNDNKQPADLLKLKTVISDDAVISFLYLAVELNLSPHLVNLLLNAVPESFWKQDDIGMPPLHHACTSNTSNLFDIFSVNLMSIEYSLKIRREELHAKYYLSV